MNMLEDVGARHVVKVVSTILKYYILYAVIFGFVIFGFMRPKKSNYLETHSVNRFFGDGVSQDRVALVEGRYESGLARIDLIENAKETLDISYYTIHEGRSLDIFWGCILDAADRGVEVRILLDGVFHNLRGDLRDVIYMLSAHPNIEFKLYEPLNPFEVWTWNNRLHDKMIIVDDKVAMMGGRNIGDKYFADNEYLDFGYDGFTVNDRDVVIINTDEEHFFSSGVYQLKEYYNGVWEHKFSQYPVKKLTKRQRARGQEMAQSLDVNLKKIREGYPQLFEPIDWKDRSVSTNKVTLIHNPIERLNKEPWCWYEIVNLAEKAEESIFVQSPYVLPTRKMLRHIDDVNALASKADILTNSIAINPNPMGTAGYVTKRKDIIDAGAKVYEFQGPGSIHAKSYIFDDRISLVGSFNMDARSAYLSTETMVVIDSEEFADILKGEIQKHKNNSLLVAEDYSYVENLLVKEEAISWKKRLLLRFLSVIAYIFDFVL